jgi:ferredoxin
MCEFCISHGEGKKWYENITNYTEEMFHQVNSEKNIRHYLSHFYHSLAVDIPRAFRWKRRFPHIYRFLAYPLVTKHLKKTHFGQVLPLEDVEKILDNFSSAIRLPCICRKATTGENKRYCFGIGMDLTPVFRDLPDFSDFEKFSIDEAKEYIRNLDRDGQTHSVWTFNTPFIAAVCNCDRDCMAYRLQMKMQLAKIMWKGEYVAEIDTSECNGCRECMQRCYFGAITYNRTDMKCSVNIRNCYGCGICRAVCHKNAITLLDRDAVPQVAHDW